LRRRGAAAAWDSAQTSPHGGRQALDRPFVGNIVAALGSLQENLTRLRIDRSLRRLGLRSV